MALDMNLGAKKRFLNRLFDDRPVYNRGLRSTIIFNPFSTFLKICEAIFRVMVVGQKDVIILSLSDGVIEEWNWFSLNA